MRGARPLAQHLEALGRDEDARVNALELGPEPDRSRQELGEGRDRLVRARRRTQKHEERGRPEA